MIMKRKFFSLVGVLLMLLLIAGCMKSYYTGVIYVDPKNDFEKIPNAKLALSVISNRQLVSGIDETITFKLENLGKEISIPEWHEKDIDNLIIYYQNWKPGTENPDPQAWIKIEPIIIEPIKRYPLTLASKSSVVVTAALPFLEGLKVTPGKERRFFIKAKLNLVSVKAESGVYAISVL
jgi:hypothetical protein